MRKRDPEEYERRALQSCGEHVDAMVRYLDAGAIVFDYGNNIRAQAQRAGFDARLRFPRFRAGVHSPALLPRLGSVSVRRALGRPGRHRALRREAARAFPTTMPRSQRWITLGARAHRRSKDCRRASAGFGYGDRAKAGLAFNELVRSGEVKAPIVIGRDHLDTGSVASPYRETEAMKDGSDAIADWPILNALLNTAAGAHWVSFHHGGGVGIGYSLHAGMVVVADGSEDARERLGACSRPIRGMGVVRHADAGYETRDRNRRREKDIDWRL